MRNMEMKICWLLRLTNGFRGGPRAFVLFMFIFFFSLGITCSQRYDYHYLRRKRHTALCFLILSPPLICDEPHRMMSFHMLFLITMELEWFLLLLALLVLYFALFFYFFEIILAPFIMLLPVMILLDTSWFKRI